MLENLNDFFTATYSYSKVFHSIQSLAIMSLLGIGLGLTSLMWDNGWKRFSNRLQVKK